MRYVSLDSDEYSTAMTICKNETTRHTLYNAQENLHKAVNIPLMDELLTIRNETAALLGYSSYSEMVIEDRMAKNISNVEKLLDGLI